MQVVTVRLDGTMPRVLHLPLADHGSNLQTLAHENTGCIPPAWLDNMAVAVTRDKPAMLKDVDSNDAVRH